MRQNLRAVLASPPETRYSYCMDTTVSRKALDRSRLSEDMKPGGRLALQWARRIRERRESLELSQMAVAKLAGISSNMVNRLEASVTVGDGTTRVCVADAMSTTVEDLWPQPTGEQLNRYRT